MANRNSISGVVAFLVLLAIVCGGIFVVASISRFYHDYQFYVGCSGRLKRAADANTVELAEKELAFAVNYAKNKGYTTGNTGILFKTPDKDIGFWYSNLEESHKELVSISPEVSKLERTNVLMKLRETLLDHDSVTVPPAISIYPYNVQWTATMWLSIIFCIVFVFSAFVVNDY